LISIGKQVCRTKRHSYATRFHQFFTQRAQIYRQRLRELFRVSRTSLCSDGNSAKSNIIYGSSQDGIHTDDTCPPSTGSSNTVTGNTINEACAGILLGSGSGNTTAPNSFLNVTNTTLAGDTCAPLDGPSEKHQSLRPSAYKMKN